MSIKEVQKLIGLIITQYISCSNYQAMYFNFVSLTKMLKDRHEYIYIQITLNHD
jgi:hypothetical protein